MDRSHQNREQVSHADLPRVVIVGGGFGGLYAARGLVRAAALRAAGTEVVVGDLLERRSTCQR